MPMNITTAIDTLVDLIKTRKKITLEDASKELGIPEQVIDEWATFLEEEGIIEKIYKFTTPYLTVKEKDETPGSSEEELKRRLDLATRHLEFILTQLKKYKVEHKLSIEDIQDVRKLIKNPKNVTKDVIFAQKFILDVEANEILSIIKKIKLLTPELMEHLEKKIDDLDKRRTIFEKNYKNLR